MLRISRHQYDVFEEAEFRVFEERMLNELRPWFEPRYASAAAEEVRSLIREVLTFARDGDLWNEHEVVALLVIVALQQLERGVRPDVASAAEALKSGGRS
ncbi:MAG: hypothetical protein L6Q76_04945 [Polyangiaceae bacterium]|nr:hypothetical protein [Polyangiaceae bacterium]